MAWCVRETHKKGDSAENQDVPQDSRTVSGSFICWEKLPKSPGCQDVQSHGLLIGKLACRWTLLPIPYRGGRIPRGFLRLMSPSCTRSLRAVSRGRSRQLCCSASRPLGRATTTKSSWAMAQPWSAAPWWPPCATAARSGTTLPGWAASRAISWMAPPLQQRALPGRERAGRLIGLLQHVRPPLRTRELDLRRARRRSVPSWHRPAVPDRRCTPRRARARLLRWRRARLLRHAIASPRTARWGNPRARHGRVTRRRPLPNLNARQRFRSQGRTRPHERRECRTDLRFRAWREAEGNANGQRVNRAE